MSRRRKSWKRPKDLPKGEIWPPDRGLHPIPESWKELDGWHPGAGAV